MKISARLTEFEKFYIQKEIGNTHDNVHPFKESNLNMIGMKGIDLLKCKELWASGILLLDVQMTFSRPVTDEFEVEGDCVVMEFLFNTASTVTITPLKRVITYKNLTHNLTYASDFKASYHVEAGSPIDYFTIVMSKDFYHRLLPQESTLHQEFLRSTETHGIHRLSATLLPFTPFIHELIYDIKHCRQKGELQKWYLENKIQALLLIQLEMYQNHNRQKIAGLSPYDISRIQEAKSFLENHFRNAPGLTELSKQVNLNEFKLKKGFKACYGITVKRYVILLKMKHAMHLLEKGDHSITEIAYLSGYNGLVQFSAAFKSFYGYAPKNIQCEHKTADLPCLK
ncbi:helix-turn-helix domain-containing protein [Sinomicrobium sp.]